MFNEILTGIFNILINFANVITAPISALLIGIFPDLVDFINVITDLLNLVVDIIVWFAYLIPPKTKFALIGLFSFYLTMKPIRFAVSNINRTLDLIKRIDPFTSK